MSLVSHIVDVAVVTCCDVLSLTNLIQSRSPSPQVVRVHQVLRWTGCLLYDALI